MTTTADHNRLSPRDAAIVAAVLALDEAERRLDDLLALGDDPQSYGDLDSLRAYRWQARRAAGDLETNYGSSKAQLAVARARGERWAELVAVCEAPTTSPARRKRAARELARLLDVKAG